MENKLAEAGLGGAKMSKTYGLPVEAVCLADDLSLPINIPMYTQR